MKKQFILGALLFLSLFSISCTNEDTHIENENNLAQTPEAMAQFDTSNYGIYKGVFIGSSGTVVVNVNNNNAITATLVIDGVMYLFTATQTIEENQVTEINFVNGNDSFTFGVAANGTSPAFTNLAITGHSNAAVIIVKEISTTLVKLYEGTFEGDDLGTFNAIIYENILEGLGYSTLANVGFFANGTVVNNEIAAGNASTGAIFSGSVNGDAISGIWSNNQSNNTGNWTGERTY